ncbi:MAG TPA: hypothetical protein VK129_11310 [Terriglobales bacterium]|nr:hypothetical protein [Terriglobales bacterium]
MKISYLTISLKMCCRSRMSLLHQNRSSISSGSFLVPALRVPPALLEPKISVFANMGCHQHQLKTHFFAAAPAKRKLFSLKQCHFMVFAMLMVQDKIESRFGNNLARLVRLFRHKVLPRGTEGAIVTELLAVYELPIAILGSSSCGTCSSL